MAEIWNNLFVLFIATRKAVVPLSCWANQYSCLDTLNIKICPLLMLWANAVGLEKCYRQRTDREERTENRQRNLLQSPL